MRPRPDIDVRPPGALNDTERLTTPYAWLTSPQCRDQVWGAANAARWERPATRQGFAAALPATRCAAGRPRRPAVPAPLQVKAFYTAVVNRRNTLTGVLYRDDPAIFSWVSGAHFGGGRLGCGSHQQTLTPVSLPANSSVEGGAFACRPAAQKLGRAWSGIRR